MPGRRFAVKLTPSFQKDLEALPRREQTKVLAALAHLERDPFGPSPRIKKLKGRGAGQLRLRIGLYRVRYDVIGRRRPLPSAAPQGHLQDLSPKHETRSRLKG